MASKPVPYVAVLLFCLLASCAGYPDAAGTGGRKSGIEGTWTLVELGGKPLGSIPEGGPPTIRFDSVSGMASGVAACNQYSASWTATAGGNLEFSEFTATKMACPDLGLEIDYFSMLGRTRSFTVEGDVLRLFGGDPWPIAAFSALR